MDGAPDDVVVEADGTPRAWVDANGDQEAYGMRGINFLLDPGDVPLDQVSFSGTVYADTNGDGLFNSNDVTLPNVTVYVDVNRNGALDSGETTTLTDAAGNYTVLQMGVEATAVMNVGVVKPPHWTATNPASGLHTELVSPGEVYGNLNFFLDPPANNQGGGGAGEVGYLIGTVFEDLDSNGVRDPLEDGMPGVTVFLDANNNGILEDGVEKSAQTNQFGAYIFAEVPPGQHVVRVEIASPEVQTTPAAGQPWVVNLTGSSTISTLHFGVFDSAVNDYGDLPESYEQRPLEGGGMVVDPAHHKKGKYWLGSIIDGELGNVVSANADGDDLVGELGDDEDGVVFDPIVAGATSRLTVTANTYTGYLQGWIDWNADGDFLDDGERVVTDQLLVAGQNLVFYNVPDEIAADNVYARFRFGEHSTNPNTGAKRPIDTPFGAAAAGEVEDYYAPVQDTGGSLVVGLPADFNQDQYVDGSDFLAWQRNVGMTTGATQSQGSADGDGDVDRTDLGSWLYQFGLYGGAAALTEGGSVNGSISAATTAAGNALNRDHASIAAWSASTALGSRIGASLETPAAGARPGLTRLAGRLVDLADRLKAADGERLDAAAERIGEAAAKIADRVESFQVDSRWDRAFDELFGRRHGDSDAEEAAAELTEISDSDEAFAELADHFGWRRN